MKDQQLRKHAPKRLSRKRRGWALAFAIITAFGCVTYRHVLSSSHSAALNRDRQNSAPDRNSVNSSQAPREISSAAASSPGTPARAVYPNSIVPGGIASVAELKLAMAKDSVVFDQYSAFHLERARIIRLDRERRAHVSYRVGNRVYWTKREVKLPKGETVITDGIEMARTKCGNLVSEAIVTPIAPHEPTEQALNTPMNLEAPNELVSDERFPGLEEPPLPLEPQRSYQPPPSANPWAGNEPPPGSVFIPPVPVRPPSGSRPPSHGPSPVPPPVINTPEPGTAAQFLLALPVIFFLRRRTKAKPA